MAVLCRDWRLPGIPPGKRNNDANESAANTLEQAAQDQWGVVFGQGYDRDAYHKEHAAERQQRFSPKQVGQQPGAQGRERCAQQHRCNDE